MGKRTVKCSLHGALCISGMTPSPWLPLSVSLRIIGQAERNLRPRQNQTRSYSADELGHKCKTPQCVSSWTTCKKSEKKAYFLLVQRKYETYPRQLCLICSPAAFYQAFLLRDLAPHPSLFSLSVENKPKIKRFYNWDYDMVLLPLATLKLFGALTSTLLRRVNEAKDGTLKTKLHTNLL